jgi:hypothetical protein
MPKVPAVSLVVSPRRPGSSASFWAPARQRPAALAHRQSIESEHGATAIGGACSTDEQFNAVVVAAEFESQQ